MSLLRHTLRETILMRVLLAFCLGIVGYALYPSTYVPSLLILLTLALIIFFKFYLNRYNITFNYYTGIIVYSVCISMGYILSFMQDERNHSAYYQLLQTNQHEVIINDNGRLSGGYCSYEVEILMNQKTVAKSILKIKDDSIRYAFGDHLLVRANLSPVDYSSHPAQFDYKGYLARKHILHLLVVRSSYLVIRLSEEKSNSKIEKSNSPFSIFYFPFSLPQLSNQTRKQLLQILKNNIKDEPTYEMGAALLLGERADVDKAVLKSYSDTGTIHIISVSGLHVGIIFLVLQHLFKLVRVLKNELLKCVLMILCIWFYAMLTGLPASVIRSACMISFYCIGKAINHQSNTINHVAASAIFLLSIDTMYLFDVGFQLSYLAVLGILYLQKWISNWYQPKNKIMTYVWSTTSVSLAAQLFTLPLCWYYYHQFPNYFIIANLIAIPLSSVALYASIGVLVFAKIPYLVLLFQWALQYSIAGLNAYLLWLSKWPMAVLALPRIDFVMCLFISLVLMSILLLSRERIKSGLSFLFIVLISMSIYQISTHHPENHEHLWEMQSPYQTQYVIEQAEQYILFFSNKTNIKSIRKQSKLWRGYRSKKQVIVIVPQRKFDLHLKGKIYSNAVSKSISFEPHYHRICL
ncbi:MAG: ComEC family competence protein [Sphingobacteriales bacterium]|nr:ComEC family competence protein [Sphingobacteriales bacterium]